MIERQYLAFDQTRTDIRQEGFDEIIELRDEDLDKVQIEIIFRPIAATRGDAGPASARSQPPNASPLAAGNWKGVCRPWGETASDHPTTSLVSRASQA